MKGALLAEIDPRPFEAQLTRSRGRWPATRRFSRTPGSTLSATRILLAEDSIAKQQLDTQKSLVQQ